MAATSVADFWRRRKLFIIVGVLLLCVVVAFVHHRNRSLQKHRQAERQELAKNSIKKVNALLKEKGRKRPSKVKQLPPVISQHRARKPAKPKPEKDRDRDIMQQWKEQDSFFGKDVKDGPKEMEGQGGKEGLKKWQGDDMGEAPRVQGKMKNKDKMYAKDADHKDKTPDKEDKEMGETPKLPQQGKQDLYPQQFQQQPEEKDLQPTVPTKRRRKRPTQSVPGQISPNQLKNQPIQRENQNWQPGNQAFERKNQPGNQQQGFQPGNQQQGFQPGNQQQGFEPGNQPAGQRVNQGFQRGDQGFQPANGQRGDQGFQHGDQPGGQRGYQGFQRGNQHGDQGFQPGNQPAGQRGNQGFQRGDQPGGQRGYQGFQRGNQHGDQGFQPGNQPAGQRKNQPGNQQFNPNQQIQPGNPPVPREDQPGGQQFKHGEQPFQPENRPKKLPLNDFMQPQQSLVTDNRDLQPKNGDTQSSRQQGNLYVHSSMPLGQPLSSTKTERQQAVVNAFKHAWKAYREYAWGSDEVNPISHSSSSSLFGLGMTLVDCLDTLWLMGLDEDFQAARNWVANSLNIDNNHKTVSLFETNIRVLGGLLSAYHLSGDAMFLDKAVKLGTRLLPAFDTPSGVPSNTVSLSDGGHAGHSISTAEAGTLQLEFRDLSRASGDTTFQKKCDQTLDKMLSQTHGIVQPSLNCNSGQYSGSPYSAGAGIDSYYEYLLKQWIQSGKTENKFRDAYEKSTQDVLRNLVGLTQPSHMAYLGKRFSLGGKQPPSPVMDHLSCFYPGMLALGVMYKVLPNTQAMAENLTHTCYKMYETTPTGIAPEIFQFNINSGSMEDIIRSSDNQNLQRPETVESLFYLYRLTKDNRYREWGWKIFQAFEKYTKIDGGGYGCLRDVHTPGQFRDRTESFFMTETLKYLYLLFTDDDSVLSLNEWVFNTEAHPLPIWRMSP